MNMRAQLRVRDGSVEKQIGWGSAGSRSAVPSGRLVVQAVPSASAPPADPGGEVAAVAAAMNEVGAEAVISIS